jgi:hypothetical protein
MATRFAAHLLTDDHASRPAANTVPEGTLYSCTDHSLIYQSDGSSWSTWASFSSSGIPGTIVAAKGDIIGASANDTPAITPVGANGLVLIAASGETAGLKWGHRGFYAAAHVKLTGGNITANQTSWGELASESGGPGTGLLDLDFTGVVAGDILECAISMLVGSAATYLYLDVATIVSASPVNYLGSVTGAGTGDGVQAWTAVTGREEPKGGSVMYTIQSGDLSAGALKLRPWLRTSSATNRTLFGSAANPFHFSAKLYRPA